MHCSAVVVIHVSGVCLSAVTRSNKLDIAVSYRLTCNVALLSDVLTFCFNSYRKTSNPQAASVLNRYKLLLPAAQLTI